MSHLEELVPAGRDLPTSTECHQRPSVCTDQSSAAAQSSSETSQHNTSRTTEQDTDQERVATQSRFSSAALTQLVKPSSATE